jgi:hypothetical protein
LEEAKDKAGGQGSRNPASESTREHKASVPRTMLLDLGNDERGLVLLVEEAIRVVRRDGGGGIEPILSE